MTTFRKSPLYTIPYLIYPLYLNTLISTALLVFQRYELFGAFERSWFFNPILGHPSFPVVQSNPINNYNLLHYFC